MYKQQHKLADELQHAQEEGYVSKASFLQRAAEREHAAVKGTVAEGSRQQR
jgi:predicted RNA-binding protein associated with RNAse of E/G family